MCETSLVAASVDGAWRSVRASPRPLVVLDPGHGGSNAGAQGAVPSLHEKQLTLAIANQVAAKLRDKGIAVELTRTDDRTLTLRQRTEHRRPRQRRSVRQHPRERLADPHPARLRDLRPHPEGRRRRRARAPRRLRRRPRPGVDPDIALVLDDVERGAAQWEAADLAARIQRALKDRRGAEGDRGVRQDAHHVLLGATMPAVLVEVGFIDHPIEGKELAEPAVQAQLAAAIAEAIEDRLAD